MDLGRDKFELYIYLADERGELAYSTEHRFLERPDVETVKALLEEAREHYSVMYDGLPEPEDVMVRIGFRDEPRERR